MEVHQLMCVFCHGSVADIQACCESKKCEKVRNNMTALEDKKFCILAADKVVHTRVYTIRIITPIASDCSSFACRKQMKTTLLLKISSNGCFLGKFRPSSESEWLHCHTRNEVNAQATAWIRRSAAQSIPSITAETRGVVAPRFVAAPEQHGLCNDDNIIYYIDLYNTNYIHHYTYTYCFFQQNSCQVASTSASSSHRVPSSSGSKERIRCNRDVPRPFWMGDSGKILQGCRKGWKGIRVVRLNHFVATEVHLPSKL